MRIYRSLEEARGQFAASAVTIGNFDGVHAAHRQLFHAVARLAQETAAKPSVLTFHPHPAMVVAPERAQKLLTDHPERSALMQQEGIEQVLILPFDEDLSRQTPEEFFRKVLVGALGARAVAVGDNFRFGRKQAGNVDTLKGLCEQEGLRLEIVHAVKRRGVTVSSSEIRRLLAEGRVSLAGRLLERPYSLSGAVVRGAGRGRKQTVPTLNLDTGSIDGEWKALPASGVYITRTTGLDCQRQWQSITNVGYRPTFEGKHLTVETFLLEPLVGESPARIRVEFLRRVREERRFPSAEDLRAQILRDVSRAQTYFRRLPGAAVRQA